MQAILRMKALWLEDQTLTLRDDIPVPEPSQDEALIAIQKVGICATDLEMLEGYYPFTGIPGHEFVGVVEAAPGDPAWEGQRVVGEINVPCHQCPACRRGHLTHCEARQAIGIKDRPGAFAEYLLLPLGNLHPVPVSVPNDAAVFTEPIAAALEILEQVLIRPSDRVLVVGAGRLGQLIAQVLSLTGCALTVIARHPHQQGLLKARKIASIPEIEVPTREMDLVVDATGSPSGFELARQAVRPRGTILLKSTYAGSLNVNLSSIVVDEVCILGSRCGPFEPALRLLADNRVDPTPLIDARYPLSESLEAFEQAAKPGGLKVLMEVL
jgi:threonine dehydrogenase-like Zn-dependent dehydrogenase